jgi:hypothetical protein
VICYYHNIRIVYSDVHVEEHSFQEIGAAGNTEYTRH